MYLNKSIQIADQGGDKLVTARTDVLQNCIYMCNRAVRNPKRQPFCLTD